MDKPDLIIKNDVNHIKCIDDILTFLNENPI